MGQPPELLLDPVEQALHRQQALADVARHVPGKVVEGEIHRGEELARLVVELARDAPGLLLQVVVEPAQRRIGLADRTMRHLEGGQTFQREVTRFPDDRHAVVRPAETGGQQGFVQQGRHVEDAETARRASAGRARTRRARPPRRHRRDGFRAPG